MESRSWLARRSAGSGVRKGWRRWCHTIERRELDQRSVQGSVKGGARCRRAVMAQVADFQRAGLAVGLGVQKADERCALEQGQREIPETSLRFAAGR